MSMTRKPLLHLLKPLKHFTESIFIVSNVTNIKEGVSFPSYSITYEDWHFLLCEYQINNKNLKDLFKFDETHHYSNIDIKAT